MPNPFETPEWQALSEWSKAVQGLDTKDPRSVLRYRSATKVINDLNTIFEDSDAAVQRAVLIEVVKDAGLAGMVIEQDDDGQLVIYTGLAYPDDADDLPEGSYDDLILVESEEEEDEESEDE